jgi:hypothetical protein
MVGIVAPQACLCLVHAFKYQVSLGKSCIISSINMCMIMQSQSFFPNDAENFVDCHAEACGSWLVVRSLVLLDWLLDICNMPSSILRHDYMRAMGCSHHQLLTLVHPH